MLGTVIVYSSSYPRALLKGLPSYAYALHHAGFAALGISLFCLLERVDYHYYRVLARPLIFGAGLLLVPLACGWGEGVHGAVRWLRVGPLVFQPVELTKVALIVYLSDSLARKRGRLREFSFGFLPYLVVSGTLVALCLAQPDFGSSAVLFAYACALPWIAGTKTGYVLGTLALAVPAAAAAVLRSNYRSLRLAGWVARGVPCDDSEPSWLLSTLCDWVAEFEKVSVQADVALNCFARGGWFGVGLGNSHEKLGYLPEPFTDFIVAIAGEELGTLGFAALLAAYALIMVRGILAARRAADAFGFYLAIGLTLHIGVQVAVNACVVLSLLPTKGLVAPMLSLGGTAMTCNCAALGILLNVARPRRARDATAVPEPGPAARSVIRRVGAANERSADDDARDRATS